MGQDGGPLPAEGTYPAPSACIITNGHMPHGSNKLYDERFPHVTHDSTGQFIAEITEGNMIGFRYFAFRGKEGLIVTYRAETDDATGLEERIVTDSKDRNRVPTCDIVKKGAKKNKEECKDDGDLYNPWWKTLRDDGVGTLKYNGKWNLFDQIIVSGHLVDGDRSHLQYFRNEIFVRDYLIQQEGKYKGNPLRTHASGTWLNGYSDHLPTVVYLIKEQR